MTKKLCLMIPRVIDEDRMRIYVAGPLSSPTKRGLLENVRNASLAGRELFLKGHYPFIPHTMNHDWFGDPHPLFHDYASIVEDFDCLGWLSICDAVLFLPGWKKSKGSRMERRYAKKTGKKIYFKLSQIPNVRKEE